MIKSEKIEIIRKNPIFENLSLFELDKIADISEEIKYNQGEIIFEENEDADAFYIIASGSVEILKSGQNKKEVLAIKSGGDVFGEMSVIDDLPRSATIRAKTNIILLKLIKAKFVELLKAFSHISIEIARSICSTVRTTNSNYILDLENRNKQLEIAYEKLKKTQDQLLSAERLSAIGKFSSLIIHDVKNPLSNIRAYTELIRMGNVDQNEKIEKSTKVIIAEVDRLNKISSELLEFARGELNLTKIPANLSSLIETFIDTIREDLNSRKIRIIFNTKCNVVVMLDVEKIQRAFLNLISNSADAITEGGLIIVKVEEMDKWARWSILDNGTGMDPNVLEKIFEPFYTNKKKGTGLGMAIVKSIIESHSGIIKVQSKIDSGTRFDIYFPKV